VVLLNGLAMLTRSWYRNVPSVYPEYDVLLYDDFGQGQSSQEGEPYFIPKFCDYLVRILDELGIERIHPRTGSGPPTLAAAEAVGHPAQCPADPGPRVGAFDLPGEARHFLADGKGIFQGQVD
jgi:pimeloyl-ACP methyl ester carboxylesterase